MEVLPRLIQGSFYGLVEDLKMDPAVRALGLFGSWVRGEGNISSDFDILVVDGSGLDYEYGKVEVRGGWLVDLQHIPLGWLREPVSPQLDYRFHEMVVLYDPVEVLGEAREFVERVFMSPRRVEARTDGLLATSEMYLSRASSALSRGDSETTFAYVGAGLTSAAVVLIDIAGVPVTRSQFVWSLRRACVRLDMEDVYRSYLILSRVSKVSRQEAEEIIKGFKTAWDGVRGFILDHGCVMDGLHGKVKRDVEYLINLPTLGGILTRVRGMIAMENNMEAVIYLRGWMLPLLEGFAWAILAVDGEKYDYTSLLRVVGGGDEVVREGALDVLGLSGVTERSAAEMLVGARELVGDLRLDRRRLVEFFIG
ncbi:MAG: nucleotidyltransferase domain-containing protein [Candidatus Bathyarchaeota archaeon]|jgi:hypothetical protein|nr:nucleotidyltransferase domain-containing protein [Candidatus Bathyarchaeota archaeon]|tara:strand:+ start:2578 stop:3678 length:1101 start_codon:yes stop_codon:yes gene_type:complete